MNSKIGLCVLSLAVAMMAVLLGEARADDPPAPAPAHKVAAIYFHRTNRCPTCRKISAYIEESIQAGFAKDVKDGRVSVSMIDFQNPQNQNYTAAYKITGPTLVLADVRDGKVTSWKPAPQVWTLVRDKDAFFKYVQDEVRGYLEAK